MEKSSQSKSFAILFGIALIGAIISLNSGGFFGKKHTEQADGYQVITYAEPSSQVASANQNIDGPPSEELVPVDTSDWKEYTSSSIKLKMKIHPDWKVKPMTKKYGFDMVAVDPGARYDDFKIYISKEGFFALSGLDFKEETIAGTSAINIQNILYGIKHLDTYYTFDMGASLSLKPQFNALVKSLSFIQ